MNRNKILLICTLASIIGIHFSCEKVIEFTGDELQSELIIHGVLNPDSLIKIHLSQSVSIFNEDNFVNVHDKIIEISENGVVTEILYHTKNGYYISDKTFPKIRSNFQLKILNNKSGESSAVTTIPEPVIIEKMEAVFTKKIKLAELYLTFKDPGNTNNYYRISFEEKKEINANSLIDSNSTNSIIRYKRINLNHSQFLGSMGAYAENISLQEVTIFNKYHIFSDEIIDGKTHILKIVFASPFSINNNATKFYINLQSLSEDYYSYLKSKTLHDALAKNSFVEPIGIKTNITNGFGILGAYVSSKKALDFSEDSK
jgi:hypothetical protein